ncbi:MAG: alpha/beta hydrolase [Rhodospirillaceae bacterium]|nr:alpha/beta hydrolase [Rhodospirillaceae bacterium]
MREFGARSETFRATARLARDLPPRRLDGPMKRADLFPYDTGFTPWMASRLDPRFALSLYVPQSLRQDDPAPLLVLIHGTSRRDNFRDGFRDFAERTGTVLLAPLFPVGAAAADDVHGYKWIDGDGVRFDLLLLDMIGQAAAIWPLAADRFALFGYSGGGQFAHRFLYLHPHRLTALSVGAPGNVTLPDPARPWPAGVSGLEERFGIGFDNDAIRAVPLHMVVGGADTETWEIAKEPGDPVYIRGVNDESTSRIERLKRLEFEMARRGSSTQFELVEGVAHDGPAVVPAVTLWLERSAFTRDL